MNKKLIKFTCILCCLCAATAAGGCKNDPADETQTNKYTYTPATKPAENDESESETVEADYQKSFPKDTSWQKNFQVTYKYSSPSQNIAGGTICEKRSSTAFTVEYTDTGTTLYYKANGTDTDYYCLTADTSELKHEVLKGKKIDSLSSLFMKLTNVDTALPAQGNVLYMYDEFIAGRNCHKYIQQAFSEAKLTESVYVWVDAQYGFAMKCEDYDAEDNLKTMWEVTEFSSGNITDADVAPDISQYKFPEEVG